MSESDVNGHFAAHAGEHGAAAGAGWSAAMITVSVTIFL